MPNPYDLFIQWLLLLIARLGGDLLREASINNIDLAKVVDGARLGNIKALLALALQSIDPNLQQASWHWSDLPSHKGR